MSYLDLDLKSIHNALVNKEIKISDLVKESLERAKQYQKYLNGFVTIDESILDKAKEMDNSEISNLLFGIPYCIKDNYSTKGIKTTASSYILNDYVPVFDATVVSKLKEKGCLSIGKTAMDELAMGGTGLNCFTGPVHNPYDLSRISGGSSAGSAVSVASGIVPFAIGSDTGDSVRKPAGYNGIVGFKPTWGRISRFGLFPFAPSLDHVAFFTRNVTDSAYILEAIAGTDLNDSTCSTKDVPCYSDLLNGSLKGKKIAVIDSIDSSLSNPDVSKLFNDTLSKLESNGATIIHTDITKKLLNSILPTYLVISCSESSSNNANLDGIKFGLREDGKDCNEMIKNTRTSGFSKLVKRRFVIGSYCLSKEHQEDLFIRAQKIRRLIVNRVNKILSECDVILTPASGDIAPLMEGNKVDELSSDYLIGENHLAIANFAGLPSLTLPCGFVDNMPIGINVTGKAFDEQEVLNVSLGIENVLGLKNLIRKVGK